MTTDVVLWIPANIVELLHQESSSVLRLVEFSAQVGVVSKHGRAS